MVTFFLSMGNKFLLSSRSFVCSSKYQFAENSTLYIQQISSDHLKKGTTNWRISIEFNNFTVIYRQRKRERERERESTILWLFIGKKKRRWLIISHGAYLGNRLIQWHLSIFIDDSQLCKFRYLLEDIAITPRIKCNEHSRSVNYWFHNYE